MRSLFALTLLLAAAVFSNPAKAENGYVIVGGGPVYTYSYAVPAPTIAGQYYGQNTYYYSTYPSVVYGSPVVYGAPPPAQLYYAPTRVYYYYTPPQVWTPYGGYYYYP